MYRLKIKVLCVTSSLKKIFSYLCADRFFYAPLLPVCLPASKTITSVIEGPGEKLAHY